MKIIVIGATGTIGNEVANARDARASAQLHSGRSHNLEKQGITSIEPDAYVQATHVWPFTIYGSR
jgi:dihydrodipicolinate reductase